MLPSRIRALIKRKEVSGARVCCGVVFIFFIPPPPLLSRLVLFCKSSPPSPFIFLFYCTYYKPPLPLSFRKRAGCNHGTRGGRCSILIILHTADKKRRTAGELKKRKEAMGGQITRNALYGKRQPDRSPTFI